MERRNGRENNKSERYNKLTRNTEPLTSSPLKKNTAQNADLILNERRQEMLE